MELLGAGIEHVGSLRGGLRAGPALQPALAGGVVDLHPGLDVVDVDEEADALAVVLHALRLHGHAAGNQILADSMKAENRQETSSSRQELLDQGYEPCGTCKP